MSTPFSTDKFPPAPILNIRLSFPGESASAAVYPALVDTGSDFTIVPLQYLLPITAPETRSAFVRGMFSQRQLATLYLVDLHVETGVLAGVEVIGVDDEVDSFESEEIILGRNILNKLYLFLNGPDSQTQLLERVPRRF
jgi:predicted aspartyl protease